MAGLSVFGLALAAGAVDALSYLALGQVFTANMTGNVVLLGLALGLGRTAHAVGSGVAFASFCAGLAAGFVLIRRAGRDRALEPGRPPSLTSGTWRRAGFVEEHGYRFWSGGKG
ncbi:DUF1275 family protein [Nonomuraea candida]|uniref:DUF1275 family protein n=1 Tax=Nonomuraea candida TaxID=359159 RepID=UPI0006939A1A|nr:YoaK family protein [Nonomuraea candida]